MIKLVAIDMDGTLLNSDNQISIENQNAIKKAIEQGVHVMIATGRHYFEAIDVLHSAGLQIPVININGAQIHSADGEILHTVPLDDEQAQALHRVGMEENIYHVLFTDKGIYPCKDTFNQLTYDYEQGHFHGITGLDQVKIHIEKIQQRIDRGEYIENFISNSTVRFLKFVFFSYQEEKLQRVSKRLESFNQEVEQFAISSSFRSNIEVNHPKGQKGNALAFMADHLGVPMEQTMAIGDNWNDLSMFRAAGLSVAMGNAEPDLVKYCDHVTKENNEHGVAHAFEQWVLNKE